MGKKAEIPRNSSSCPRKGRGEGKNSSPRLVLDLGKILPKVSSSTSSSPDDPSRTSDITCIFLYHNSNFPLHIAIVQYAVVCGPLKARYLGKFDPSFLLDSWSIRII